jgi:peptidoglycan-associated lipoprotein
MIRARRSLSPFVLLPTLMLFLGIGCAKIPVSTLATSPTPVAMAQAPIGAASPATSPGESYRGSGSAGTARAGAATNRPRPAEFRPESGLKDIHFDFDQSAIRLSDAAVLAQNANWMKANPRDLILIEGHADERGTNEYNLALGDRRARTTKDYLVAQGVQASRVTTLSYGEERPVCGEHNEGCWAQNRRAHFLVKAQ